jgi:hypothetical protein
MTKTARRPETYSAWLKSLPAEERWHATIIGGHMIEFWMVVICKSILQADNLSVGERLRVSEMLDDQTKGLSPLKAEEIAMMQPAGKAENEIFVAAGKAGTGKTARPGTLDLLLDIRLFDLLTAANPSVLDVIKRRHLDRKARGASAAAMYAANSKHDLPTPAPQPAAADFYLDRPKPPPAFARGAPGHADGGFNVHTGR